MILQIPVDEWVEKSLADLRADSLPVIHEIAVEAYRLPEPFHRDPADRQIVACARLHELTVVTADERIVLRTLRTYGLISVIPPQARHPVFWNTQHGDLRHR